MPAFWPVQPVIFQEVVALVEVLGPEVVHLFGQWGIPPPLVLLMQLLLVLVLPLLVLVMPLLVLVLPLLVLPLQVLPLLVLPLFWLALP